MADPQGLKLAWWLLLTVAAVAAWPVTVVTAAGYVAAWLRGWPPVRLYRAAAWSLPVTAAWLAGLEIQEPGFLASRDPGRTWTRGWDHLTTAHLAGVFGRWPRSPFRPGWRWPGCLGVAELHRHRRAGRAHSSAPITFDARQWGRQVRTAQGLTHAPGAVPLLARGNKIPVGGTIRAIGHPWHPVFTLDPAACARHMVIVGSTGSGKTNLMIRLWAGWFTATLQAWRAGRGGRRCWWCWTARAAATPAESRPDPPPALRRRRPPGRHLAGRGPPVHLGPPPADWRCCCTR